MHYLMQFFEYDHLPTQLKEVSIHFSHLAQHIDNILPENPEKTTALRKLLEAKDCAVRARLYAHPGAEAVVNARLTTVPSSSSVSSEEHFTPMNTNR
jgi:hypothetical protein